MTVCTFFFSEKESTKEKPASTRVDGWKAGFSFCCVFWCAGIWGGVSCSTKRGKTSSFSLGKKKQKPERHARSGKSPHSPHFRCGRARSRDVGCDWDGSRPACASPPRKRASGFACTPLRRRSALAGAWLRGRIFPAWVWERAGGKWKGLNPAKGTTLFCCN